MPDIEELQQNTVTANVTVTTTSETVAVSSGGVKMPRPTARVLIIAWCLMTSGAGTTSITARVRRGTATSGTLVGEANLQSLAVAAGGNESVFKMVSEARADEESVEYSLTVEQAAATGNGTVLEAAIAVLVLNG